MHGNIAMKHEDFKYFFQEVSDFDNTTDKNSTTDIISGWIFTTPKQNFCVETLDTLVQPCLEE